MGMVKRKCCEAPCDEVGREGGGGEPPQDFYRAKSSRQTSQQKMVESLNVLAPHPLKKQQQTAGSGEKGK
jgi:hypothetical protein